jgi:hypothetical protein
MKRAVDIQMVAHFWANQEQDFASTPNGSLYFQRDCIYSYGAHFMIARHVENSRGERAVLMTKSTYSRTTAAHITIVKQASRHLNQILVPDPDMRREDMFEQWYSEMRNCADQLSQARKPQKYIWEIQAIFGEVEAYAAFFDCEIPQYLSEAGQIQNGEQYHEVLRRETEIRKAQEEKERLLQLKVQKERLKLWRTFKTNRLHTVDGFDYLRYNKTTERVETSQNVEIPALVARRFYTLVMETIAGGGCADCRFRLMDRYEVSTITKDLIRVGCHQISLKEIKSFTKKQGW